MNRIVLLAIAFAFVVFGCKNSSKNQKNDEVASTEVINKDAPLPELSVYNLPSNWKNQEDKELKLQDFRGKIVVAVMIYTTCRASCPKLIADMKRIRKAVNPEVNKLVEYVFVSIDPETDTPKRLKDFSIERGMNGEGWNFLTGSEEDTREFAAVLGMNYKRTSPIDFAHSNIISVFDQQGVLTFQKEGLDKGDKEIVEAIEKLQK